MIHPSPSRRFGTMLILTFTLMMHALGTAQNRPKIGLVLSGGGARGFAHIGTLKMLDSLQIPIDYIAGTSMGGIVGALYAIGYSGLEIEKLTHRTDWLEIFSDSPPRNDLPFFQKKDTGKYQLKFDLEGLHPKPPSGLIFGQKISLIFSALTFPYENITNFDDLPIPFRCVAVDLVTGNQVVLKGGSLSKAMRSTMAIPTVFSPVGWGDSLLVDGGIQNNLPVDVVKEMGADIIIAVDVGTLLMDRDELNTALKVLEQSIAMQGIDRWKENLKDIDVLIQPELLEFGPSNFHADKVRGIVDSGIRSGHEAIADLIRVKAQYNLQRINSPQQYKTPPETPRIFEIRITGYQSKSFQSIYDLLDLKPNDPFVFSDFENRIAEMRTLGYFKSIDYEIIPVSDNYARLMIKVTENQTPIIHGISIVGNESLPFTYIYDLLGLQPTQKLDTEDLNRRIMTMYGLGYFESIRYDIRPCDNDRIYLTLHLKERSKRKLRLGLRFDKMHKLVAAVSVQGTNFLMPGLRYEHEIIFPGLTQYHFKTYYPSRTLNMPVYPYFRFLYKDIPVHIYDAISGKKMANYVDRSTTFALGLGFLLSQSFNIEIELQDEAMHIKPDIAMDDPFRFPIWKDRLRKVHAEVIFDRLDDTQLPRRGFLFKARYEGSYKQLNTEVEYALLTTSLDFYHSFHPRHTVRFYGYSGFGRTLPVYKFLNQGRPSFFVGMNYDQLFGTKINILRLGYRFQWTNDLFLKLMGNVAFDLEYEVPEWKYHPRDIWGIGVGVKAITPVGPIEVIFSYGDGNFLDPPKKQKLIYFTLGANIGKYLYD